MNDIRVPLCIDGAEIAKLKLELFLARKVVEAARDHVSWCNKNGWDGVLIENLNEALRKLEGAGDE